MTRTRPSVRPLLRMALVVTALTCLSAPRALAQDPRVLSLVEIALADCVGQALAMERALRDDPATPPAAVARATVRADALLQRAVSRYVAVNRVEPFHRRVARTLEGSYLRMNAVMDVMGVSGDRGGVISRTEQRFERDCAAYLD